MTDTEAYPKTQNRYESMMRSPKWLARGTLMTSRHLAVSMVMLSEFCTPEMAPRRHSGTRSCSSWVTLRSLIHRPGAGDNTGVTDPQTWSRGQH